MNSQVIYNVSGLKVEESRSIRRKTTNQRPVPGNCPKRDLNSWPKSFLFTSSMLTVYFEYIIRLVLDEFQEWTLLTTVKWLQEELTWEMKTFQVKQDEI